jgi:hypothetical protein
MEEAFTFWEDILNATGQYQVNTVCKFQHKTVPFSRNLLLRRIRDQPLLEIHNHPDYLSYNNTGYHGRRFIH